MLTRKVITYALVLITFLAAFLSSYSNPIERWLFNRYSLRWHVKNDESNRVQTIALYNSADTTSPKVRLRVDVPPDTSHAILDFEYGTYETGGGTSFFETISRVDSLKNLPGSDANRFAAVADEHATTKDLSALDTVLDESFIQELRDRKVADDVITGVQSRINAARHIPRPCRKNDSTYQHCMAVEGAVGRLELSRSTLQAEGVAKWWELAGVRVTPPDGMLSPRGTMYFDLSLGAGEAGFLRLRRGPYTLKNSETALLPVEGKHITKVDSVADLRLPAWQLLLSYYPRFAIPVLALIILFLWLARDKLVPIRLRSTHRVFNLALRTDEHDTWEVALQRHRSYILFSFWLLCKDFGKNASIGPDEVLSFIRFRLHYRSIGRRKGYKNEGQLNGAIRSDLKLLAAFV